MAENTSEVAGWEQPRHGTFCWTEIASSDADACQHFYKEVFGWSFHGDAGSSKDMDYREYSTGTEGPVGGLYQIDPERVGGSPPHFMSYIAVDDIDTNAKLAGELGGKIHTGPMDIPNVGRMCLIEDPTGAMFCTFSMTK